MSKAVGMITSPGEYSDVMYYEKHECLWVIDAEEKKCIDFEILQMQIGESIKCQEKSVSVSISFFWLTRHLLGAYIRESRYSVDIDGLLFLRQLP